MLVYRTAWQVIDPLLVFNQANVFVEEIIAVPESGSTADDEEFRLGASEGDVDTTPVA